MCLVTPCVYDMVCMAADVPYVCQSYMGAAAVSDEDIEQNIGYNCRLCVDNRAVMARLSRMTPIPVAVYTQSGQSQLVRTAVVRDSGEGYETVEENQVFTSTDYQR